MKNYWKFFIFFGLITVILISFSAGYITKEIKLKQLQSPPKEIDFSLLWEAYNTLEKNFFHMDEVDYQKLVYGAVFGMIDSLGDPYTVFFDPENTKKFIESTDGKFEGVGMEVGIRDNKFQVVAPLKDTPADRAGLKAGDLILEIDGKPTNNLSVDECINLIRGPKGTKVVLVISRKEWDQIKEIEIERDVIKLPSLEWEIVDEKLAYIKFYHFYKNAEIDFNKMAFEILNSPVEGIILDLRNNTGGYLDVAKEIGGWFLEKGTLFVIQGSGENQEKSYVKGTGRLSQYPTVVIINQGSASASEILAGALRDQRKVPIVGQTSFGKGSIQRFDYLSDGSSLKITISEWFTPNEILISEKGLIPDFEIEREINDNEIDNQLEKAVELLKEII